MNRRTFLRRSLTASLGLAVAPVLSGVRRQRQRPNILLLFSDQHNARVLGCAEHPEVKTPNLDRLAGEGVQFRRAYCQDGICTPSRVSMFTGLYPRTTGCLDNRDRTPMADRLHPLHMLLKEHGYVTASIGKRHLPPGLREGFDCTATTISPKLDPSDECWRDWVIAQGDGEAAQRDTTGSKGSPLCSHISDLSPEHTAEAYTAGKSIEFIREAAKGDKPFFCFCSFQRPHQPYTPVRKWANMYDPAKIALPGNLRQPAEQLPPMMRRWRENSNRPWCLAEAAKDERMYRNYVAYYYALVSEIDHYVGELRKTLDSLGLAEDTIVVYTSDHGDFVAGHGMVEKCALGQNVYEDTLAVPLIMHVPGRCRSGIRGDLVELVDLYPTLLGLVGIENPYGNPLPGRSLVDNLTNATAVGREFAVSENWSQLTVIGQRYKLGTWLESPNPRFDFRSHGDMLFDLKDDPLETVNLAGNRECAAVEKTLRDALEEWIGRTPDQGKQLTRPTALNI